VDGRDVNKSASKSLAGSWLLLTKYYPNSDLYDIAGKADRAGAANRPLENALILWLKNQRAEKK
jgi:hypothetical protein